MSLVDEDKILVIKSLQENQAFPFKDFLPILSAACKNARPILVIAICVFIVSSVIEIKWKVLCKITIHI